MDKIKLHNCYKCLLLVLVGIFLTSLWCAYKNLRANWDHNVIIKEECLSSHRGVTLISDTKNDIPELRFDSNSGYASFFIRFPERVKTGVLEIELRSTRSLKTHNVYMRLISGEPFANNFAGGSLNTASNKWLPLRPGNHNYRFPLYRNYAKSQVLVQIKYTGKLKHLFINSIVLKPANYFDFPVGAMLICLIVIAAMFLPGLIVASTTPVLSFLPLPISSYLYSLIINLFALFFVYLFANNKVFFFVVIASVVALIFLLRSKNIGWRTILQSIYKKNKHGLFVWIITVGAVCLVLSYMYPSVVGNVHQNHITGQHTFQAFTAHDSLFQFFNAKSILEGDFEKYYGENHNKLIYPPEAREILPGLGYASTLTFIKHFLGDSISEQYFPYAVYFLISHALMLCMIFYWFESYDLKLAYIVTFFIATTPVFWVLANVGWFKLTGAALVLAGIYIIKDRPQLLSRWICAGVLFGFAKNYHSGIVLTYPIFTLWLLFVSYKSSESVSLKRIGLYFIVFTASACTFIFPWNLYLHYVWHAPSHMLLAEHFLSGEFVPDSLLQSITQFFSSVPFNEQMNIRFERLMNAVDVGKMAELYARISARHTDMIAAWLKLSSSFFVPAVGLYALLAICIMVTVNLTLPGKNRNPLPTDIWLNQFGWICLINVILLVFASYGSVNEWADITWHLPVLLIVGVLAHVVYLSCKAHKNNANIWAYVGFFQFALLLAYG